MKKLLYIFFALSIVLSACKKEDDNTSNSTSNPYSGFWSGEYWSVPNTESGEWEGTITSNGDIINAEIKRIENGQVQEVYAATGSVSNSGTFNLVIGTASTGAVFSSTSSTLNTVTGFWENSSAGIAGNWSGQKQ